MAKVNIELDDFVNAKDGSILIRSDGKWVLTDFGELNKANEERLSKIDGIGIEVNALKRNAKHFVVYAKSHFLVAFNYFKIKILSGEIDIADEEVLHLDEKVLNGELSVEDAIRKNEFLESVFKRLYLDEKELKEFPEV